MTRIFAPIALAAALAAAALATTPRPALALSDPVLSAGDGSGDSTVCGQGSRVECGSTTTYKCISWVYQPNFSISPGGGGGGYTMVCAQSVTTTVKLFKD
jgi:hypothetical protein